MLNFDQEQECRALAEGKKRGEVCNCGWFWKGRDAQLRVACTGYHPYKYEPGKLGVPDGPRLPCNVMEEPLNGK